MGFTEKEVGHMSYYKWSQLFKHFKAMYNFETRQNLYSIGTDTEEAEKKADVVYF